MYDVLHQDYNAFELFGKVKMMTSLLLNTVIG